MEEIPIPSLIDETLLRRPGKPRPAGVLYVTDVTKPCLRKAYLDIVDPQPYPVETLRVFEAGNVLEDYWLRVLSETPGVEVLGRQLPAYYYGEGFEVHGRVDALVQHRSGGLHVHEVKSTKSLRYVSVPMLEHVDQLQFYLNCLGVEWGQVDYLDKSVFLSGGGAESSIDRSFSVRRNADVFSVLLARANRLYNSVRDGSEPSPTPGWLCDYCLHRSQCSKE